MIVVWFHFVRADASLDVGIFKYTAPDGALGVTIFFVISGFILPFSLWKSGYIRADYGRFILKRITRLDPPYFASIAIALIIAYLATLSPLYRGVPFSISGFQLLLHVGYLNAFFGKPWILRVYWTLAIEFQYYLVLGLIFHLLQSRNRLLFTGFVLLCVVSQYLFFSSAFLPFHWPLFLMGIVVFRHKASIIRVPETLVWIAVFFLWAALEITTVQALVGAISALSIMYLSYGNKVTTFLANISYSLYLVHEPIGNRVVNLGARYATNSLSALLVAFVALFVSIASAYIMYQLIERPAQQLSGRIRYRSEERRLIRSPAAS